MSIITVSELLESGVHFGHRASRWNPKMRPFIHGKRNTIHIIDLKETVKGLVRATHFLKETAAEGGKVRRRGPADGDCGCHKGILVRSVRLQPDP